MVNAISTLRSRDVSKGPIAAGLALSPSSSPLSWASALPSGNPTGCAAPNLALWVEGLALTDRALLSLHDQQSYSRPSQGTAVPAGAKVPG